MMLSARAVRTSFNGSVGSSYIRFSALSRWLPAEQATGCHMALTGARQMALVNDQSVAPRCGGRVCPLSPSRASTIFLCS